VYWEAADEMMVVKFEMVLALPPSLALVELELSP